MCSGARILLLLVVVHCSAILRGASGFNDLRVAYQWKQLGYKWPDNQTRDQFPDYQPENNLPLGLEVTRSRVFVTVPRWKLGVVSSLNYFYRNDTSESPDLIPYPSWSSILTRSGGLPEVISPFRIRADRCNRLWVLDTGLSDILGTPEQLAAPSLLVYDLTRDRLDRKHVIPGQLRTPDSLFANLVVEDRRCEDSYAYLGDLGGPGLVVYSWRMDKSWLVRHASFEPDPKGSEFNVSGISFQWTDGLFGMALAPAQDGRDTLYYHPLSSSMEFSVSTSLLKDEARANVSEKSKEFKALGTRGANGQSSVSFYDPGTGVLFYALTNLNAIACWRPREMFLSQDQGLVYMDNVTMVFPNDLKIDQNGSVWVLSDRLPTFMYSRLDPNDFNFRILTGPAKAIIKDTVCAAEGQPFETNNDEPSRTTIEEDDAPVAEGTTAPRVEPGGAASTATISGLLLVGASLVLLIGSSL